MKRKRAATERFNFTKKKLEALVTDRSRRTVYDTVQNGLALAIYGSGNKTWFWFKSVAGKPTWATLGSFPAMTIEMARKEASKKNADLEKWKADDFEGRDPFEKRERLTFEAAVEFYVDERLRMNAKNFERAAKEARWLRDRYLAQWKMRPLVAIRRTHVKERQHEIRRDNGLYLSNHVVRMVRAVYNYMLESERWEGMNPCARVKLFREEKRKRFLQRNELPKLFAALQTEPNIDLRDFVLLALTTGARRGDILSARWEQFQFDRNVWVVPDPKNQVAYEVRLSAQAVSVLQDRRHRVNGDFVFPSNGTTGHIVELKGSWKRLLRRAGISDLRVHDLRRTLASWQATAGSSLLIIGKSLGHTSVQATEVYSQVADDAVRDSVAKATKKIFSSGKVRIEKLLEQPREAS